METFSAFPSPSQIILSHYPAFHASLGIWLCQEHCQSQHRWFRNPHKMCHGRCALPFLKAGPVPYVLMQPPFPRNRLFLDLCILGSTIPRVSQASEFVCFIMGRKQTSNYFSLGKPCWVQIFIFSGKESTCSGIFLLDWIFLSLWQEVTEELNTVDTCL